MAGASPPLAGAPGLLFRPGLAPAGLPDPEGSLHYLLKHPLFWLGILGVAWLWKSRGLSAGARLWAWNFFLWCLVYLTAVYWHRFALPALFLAAPLAAHFLVAASGRLTSSKSARAPAWLPGAIIAAFLILFYPWSGLDYLGGAVTQGSHPPDNLVQFLQAHVPRQWLIETPAYELAFLDDEHRIHLMPSYYFVEATPDKVVLFNPRPQPYDFARVGADVLVLGNFGKGVFRQVYPAGLVARDWRRIAQVDYYDIYVRQPRDLRRDGADRPLQKTGASRPLKAKGTTPPQLDLVRH